MKLGKKLLAMFAAATLVIGTAVTAFGATTTQDVLNALTSAGASSSQVASAKSYLDKQTGTLNLDDAVSKINDAAAILKTAGITDLSNIDASKLTAAQKAQLKTDVTTAASDVGASAVITTDSATGKKTVTVKGADGSVLVTLTSTGAVAASASTLQHTATNYYGILAAGFALVLTAAGSFVALRKKEVSFN